MKKIFARVLAGVLVSTAGVVGASAQVPTPTPRQEYLLRVNRESALDQVCKAYGLTSEVDLAPVLQRDAVKQINNIR